MNRREFACGLVAGAVALPSTQVGTQAAQQDAAAPSASSQLLAILKARFSDRLNDEQWVEVGKKIDAQLATSKVLREFKLQNSDEPATMFVPYYLPLAASPSK